MTESQRCRPGVLAGVLTVVMVVSSGFAHARELSMDTFMMLSEGMTEAEVLSRTGQPDQRIEQFEDTPLGQRVVTYQYVWIGEASKDEWTTTVTFSSKTSKVLEVTRDRK